ncbi:TIM barrel protein [Kineococcus aurantiacus]|uniref:Inosose dehydratase n=1 Tax=Kineococcus aurantiacus TaxID=37633 RepID=A0A7Y9AUZ6_9ACTN|nr:inosose dehydratase [Kineococcus aurantiacus]
MSIRRAYAVNQWKPNFDDFCRPDAHLRAFKTVVAAGFTGVELRGGTGRWDPLGRPSSIENTYGSLAAFGKVLTDVGLAAVSSWAVDPGEPVDEELSHGRSVLDRGQHAAIVEWARPFAAALAELGGSRLVVRALPAAWQVGAVDDAAVATAAECFDALGAMTAGHGVRVSLHADVLSAAADDDVLDRLLAATDPAVVGLTVDTGELTLAGLDPVAVVRRHAARLDHLQLKDTRFVDTAGERLRPHAEHAFLTAGGDREVERWFFEVGTRGGLVDAPAVLDAARGAGYDGWVVFESEQTPNPASSVMLNGWYAGHRLGL